MPSALREGGTGICTIFALSLTASPDGGIGRRVGLKHQWTQVRAGSIPALGTDRFMIHGKWPTSRRDTYDSGRSSGRNTFSLRARRAPMRRALDVSIPYLYPRGYALLRVRTFLPLRGTQGHRGRPDTTGYKGGGDGRGGEGEWEEPSRPESRGLWKGYCLGVIR